MSHSVSKARWPLPCSRSRLRSWSTRNGRDVDTVLTKTAKSSPSTTGFTIAAGSGESRATVSSRSGPTRTSPGSPGRHAQNRSWRQAVIPGLIDAHAHLMRAAETWAIEVRLDGVDFAEQALEMVRAKAAALGPGQWVYNLGGWSYDQFADNRAPLTRAELDQAAPNNPVYLQFTRCCAFLNSRGG